MKDMYLKLKDMYPFFKLRDIILLYSSIYIDEFKSKLVSRAKLSFLLLFFILSLSCYHEKATVGYSGSARKKHWVGRK